jgi:aspartyl/asparaginyl-tRNA synthetase
MDFFVCNVSVTGTVRRGGMFMKREFSTYEVMGYDDQGKIKFIHLREGEFVLPIEIKGDDLRKIKKMMELNQGVTVIVHAAIDQRRMRLLEVDGYSLRKEET